MGGGRAVGLEAHGDGVGITPAAVQGSGFAAALGMSGSTSNVSMASC